MAQESFINNIQQLMWDKVGIVRTRQGNMTGLIQLLQSPVSSSAIDLATQLRRPKHPHTAGRLIARSALARLEAAAHITAQTILTHEDARFKKHSIVGEKDVRFV
jgi:aspartate oxidase